MAEFSEKDFDVIGFAKELMIEIESIRSYKEQKDEKTGDGFQLPTESRLNAFFRLIGFPYFVNIKDKKNEVSTILHAGFGASVRAQLADKILTDSNIEYTNPEGETIALNDILSDRVIYLSAEQKESGTNAENEKMTKAMFSPLNVVANFPTTLLGDEKFTPEQKNDDDNARYIFKKLFPLVPSISDHQTHRVIPLKNEIARPFTLDEKERRLDSQTILRKPFLEEAIRIRYLKLDSSQTTKQKEMEKDMRDSLKSLLGESEFSTVFGNGEMFSKVTILEEFIINKFINAIGNMAKRWVKINGDRIRLLRQVKPNITIKTVSSKESIFGKRVTTAINLDGTSEGQKIKQLNKRIAEEEALISLLSTDEDETTNVGQSQTKNVTPNALQNPFMNLLTYNLQKNKEKQTSIQNKVKGNVKTLEKIRLEVVDLMTGEFTGLSLPDVVIVLASLFVVEKKYLLYFLDKYAIDNMKTDNTLKEIVKDIEPSATRAMEAIIALEKVVNQLFQLFDKEVEVVNNRSKQTRRGIEKKIYADKSSQQPKPQTCVKYKGDS